MSKVIAIDGPSGAGKSSVSKIVGKRLGFLHVDSGALYRIMTWQCLENAVDTSSPVAVADFASKVDRLVVIEELDGIIETHCKNIGVEVADGVEVEISPLFANSATELAARLKERDIFPASGKIETSVYWGPNATK